MTVVEDLRSVLLDVSLDLIERDGLAALSMREVARRAGVSHQAPYHHFADKEEILAALAAEGFRRLHAAMHSRIDDLAAPAQRLTAIGEAYLEFAQANPGLFQLMFRSEMVKPEEHAQANAEAEKAFDILVDVANDVSAERLGEADPAMILVAWSIAHGLSTLLLEGRLVKYCERTGLGGPEAAAQALALFKRLVEKHPAPRSS